MSTDLYLAAKALWDLSSKEGMVRHDSDEMDDLARCLNEIDEGRGAQMLSVLESMPDTMEVGDVFQNPTMAHQRMAGELGLHLCRIGTTWEVRPGPGPRPR